MQLLGSKGCVKRKNRFYSAKERAKNAPLLRLKGKICLSLCLLPKSYKDGTNYQSAKVHNFCDVPKRLQTKR